MKWSNEVAEIVNQEWYTQGLTAFPIYLNPCAYSGFEMHKFVSFGYTRFLFGYKNGYGEMSYLMDDLHRLWGIVSDGLAEDESYLKKLADIHEANFVPHQNFLNTLDDIDYKDLPDNEVLGILKQVLHAQFSAVGISHVLEAVGLGLEREIKTLLYEELDNKLLFNRYYSKLTQPTQLSFLAQEERELSEIGNLTGKARTEALREHAKKYFWIQNSYASVVDLGVDFFETKLSEVLSQTETADDLSEPLPDFVPSQKLKRMLLAADFSTLWQDRRKEKILRTLAYLKGVLTAIAQRLEMEYTDLCYLGASDVENLSSLSEIKQKSDELKQRVEGSAFIMSDTGEQVLVGEDYDQFTKAMSAKHSLTGLVDQMLYGSIANMGTAIGKVRVCKDLSSIDQVEEGEVLVASMTRPEFMPALKKAIAIVTDEGGITCHAAIVSRELNLPAIIGTKFATKVLEDGMLVEVRANHGFIKILEN